MKKHLFSFLLLLSFAFGVSAQAVKPSETEKNLRTHVVYLASEKLEGRRTGEQGATFAAGYVANMFAQYKLKAGILQTSGGKTSKSYMQPFPFVTGVEQGETGNEFRLNINNQTVENVQVKPAGFSASGEAANAEIVFAGFGITSNEQKYDDYKNLDARGKIVLVFDGAPDASFSRFDARAKAIIAKEKGAVALVLISRQTKFEDEKLAQMKYEQTLGEAALPTFIASRETAQKILGIGEKELKTVEDFTSAKKDSALKVTFEFPNAAPRASFKVNLVKKQTESYNVIGILEGSDPLLKNEAIVIGAHYDHLGRGGASSLALNSTEIHHGADDNASGVAAMLELARTFAKEKKNRRTIVFIAFGGEEEGLLGSKFYVNNPAFPLAKTVAMINLDMVGRLNENKLTVGGIGTASEWKSLVEVKNSEMKGNVNLTPVSLSNMKSVGGIVGKPTTVFSNNLFVLQLSEDGFGPSDHSSFYGKQIPVLFFFTGTHADYHKPSDTSEKINYAGLIQITNYVGEIVRAIDQNQTKPTYTVAKSSQMGGRTTFNVSLGTVPSYSENTTDGLLLDGVRDASPAAKAGLKAGDKIIKLAGRDVRNISDYMFVLGEMKANEEYEVVVKRGAETLTLKIVPAARK